MTTMATSAQRVNEHLSARANLPEASLRPVLVLGGGVLLGTFTFGETAGVREMADLERAFPGRMSSNGSSAAWHVAPAHLGTGWGRVTTTAPCAERFH